MANLTYDILLGMGTLAFMDTTIRIGNREWGTEWEAAATDFADGLRECSQAQRERLQAFLDEELPKFAGL